MYSREQIIETALELPGSAVDMPFEGDDYSTVLRHADSLKWFGIILKGPRARVGLSGEGQAALLNLKCDPLVSYGLMREYPDIIPAYHMNKHLWITIRLEGDVPRDVLEMLMRMSYDLTRVKPKRRGKMDTKL